MNKELLFDSFSYLDENLIARSEAAKARISWHRWAGIAACLALVAMLAVPAIRSQLPRAGQAAQPDPDAAECNDPITIPANTPDPSESNGPVNLPEYTPDVPPSNSGSYLPADGLQGDVAPAAPKAMISAYDAGDVSACYATPRNGEVNFSMPLRAAMAAYGDSVRYRVVVDLFRDEDALAPDGADAKSESARLGELGYISAFETYTDAETSQTWFTLHASYTQLADFAAGEYGYMFFLYGERVPGGSAEISEPVIYNAGLPTESTAVCPPAPQRRTLTAQQARADADFGAYLCDAPKGFAASDFLRTDTQLSAYYTHGYDYVEWHATRCTEADRTRIVSLDHPEDYDLSRYPIPRAQSVPADKRAVVDEPIFRADELTLEAVRARAERLNDAGDSTGERICFAVLYDGGILVRVSTKGVSTDWVYAQIKARG